MPAVTEFLRCNKPFAGLAKTLPTVKKAEYIRYRKGTEKWKITA